MTRQVVVSRLWDETPEVRCFELRPADGTALPPAEPGAHIDVHVAGGLVRQYSLWNGPRDGDAYYLGVKREAKSRGGSVAMHALKAGDRLDISAPRNNFRLHAHDAPALLLAGGIGVTPLLAMARHLEQRGTPFGLHLFARDAAMAPFSSILDADARMTTHCGLVPPALDGVLERLLSVAATSAHVYSCGPAPFMDLVTTLARTCGLPEERIHLEYFAAAPVPARANGRFEVVARRSGITVMVEPGQTMAQALIEAGVDLLTSCEQGACGTCATTVVEGEPEHRDVYFNAREHASGKVITPCVSRCKGSRIVLDL